MRLINGKKAVRGNSLFDLEWVKEKSGITNEMVPTVKKRGWERKQILCKNVFNTFFQIVIDDIIDNDVVFYAPIKNYWKMRARAKTPMETARIYKNPEIYTGVDFVRTNGKVYSIRIVVPHFKEGNDREVRINYADYKRMERKANDGYIYCGVKDVRAERYMDLMKEEFPTVPIPIIKKIIRRGSYMIEEHLFRFRTIVLSNPQIKFRVAIYQPRWALIKSMAEK